MKPRCETLTRVDCARHGPADSDPVVTTGGTGAGSWAMAVVATVVAVMRRRRSHGRAATWAEGISADAHGRRRHAHGRRDAHGGVTHMGGVSHHGRYSRGLGGYPHMGG